MTQRRAPGEGTVCKRSDGRWIAQMTLPDGKRGNPVYAKTRKDAVDKLRGMQRDLAAGLVMGSGDELLKDHCDHWLDQTKAPRLRPITLASYRSHLAHLAEHCGHLRLRELRADHLEALYATLRHDGMEESTLRTMHTIVGMALDAAVTRGKIVRNPARGMEPPHPLRKERALLDADGMGRLLDVSQGTRYHALYAVLLGTGCRIGEALGLYWDDIDGEALAIRRQFSNKHLGPLKTDRSDRTIMLPVFTQTALQRHRTMQKVEMMERRPLWVASPHVFCGELGGEPSYKRARLAFTAHLQEAGLPPLRFHDLRHTAATRLLEAGASLYEVKELLGHASVSTTDGVYAHVTRRMRQETARTMDRVVRGG